MWGHMKNTMKTFGYWGWELNFDELLLSLKWSWCFKRQEVSWTKRREHSTPCPKLHLCADGSGRKQVRAGMKEMGSHRFCSLSA